MSESSESWIGPIIFIVTFLGLFIMLLGLMPPGFMPPSHTYGLYDVPDNFNPAELTGVQFFLQKNVTFGSWPIPSYTDFDFNLATPAIDRVFRARAYGAGGATEEYFQFEHLFWHWWIIYQWDAMIFEPSNVSIYQYEIYRDDVVRLMDAQNKSKFVGVHCDHASMTAWLSDSNVTRNQVLTAWDEGKFTVSIGMGMNATEGAYGGWDILIRLLTFQAPEILGLTGDGATILNYAIALPIWAMIGYLIYRLILIAIPFLG